MCFLGQTTQGVYRSDPLDGIHPDAINRYYGVHGPHSDRHRNQTGAGHASDDDEGSDRSSDEGDPDDVEVVLENRIGQDQERNIRHAPIKVARHESPFDNAEQEVLFMVLLRDVFELGELPEHYGVRDEEWETDDYPEMEIIRPGTRGKEIPIVLLRDEWFPRAVKWVQALDVMSRVLSQVEADA
ncbi:hypothetical protein B0H17DRAFT_1013903 [Mycena rosella]|uniref:Uncharacterized protein n=1 Tax=Mycena rosella TaxID=1033263 RepID=A0AAD7D982_MYCRO|nr:hypothetical protein B0H17DRAFT_1013903 [Mycena rosella]